MRRYERHGDYHEMGCLELLFLSVGLFLIVAAALSFAVQSGYLQ